jgi:hypothetical protein
MASSTVVEQLTRYCRETPKTVVAYFYFDFNDSGKRDVNSLLRSLIAQLFSKLESTPPPLFQLYETHQNTTSIDQDILMTNLQNLILTFHSVYLIFDALDESSECEEVLNLIHNVVGWNFARLHILVTSRQLTEIEESFSTFVTNKICLQDSDSNKDIVIFVADKLENDKKLSMWPPDIRLQIERRLLDGEDGM